jgi:hypothetical protein
MHFHLLHNVGMLDVLHRRQLCNDDIDHKPSRVGGGLHREHEKRSENGMLVSPLVLNHRTQ